MAHVAQKAVSEISGTDMRSIIAIMVIPRFYVPLPLAVGQSVALPEAVANHAVRVLRLQPDDPVVLFNGEGGAYAGRLLAREHSPKAQAPKKQRDSRNSRQTEAEVVLDEFQPDDRASNLRVTLWQGVSAAERMDYTWQKSVELGVHRCMPIETRRCVTRLDAARAEKRHAHWQGVIVSAAEQCGLNRLPELVPVQTLAQALAQPVDMGVRVMLDPDATESFPIWLERQQGLTNLTILIGPEGGFASEEIAAAQEAGFLCFRLGPRVFRTETAGPVALAVTQAIAGDLR
jgi:16S rRNA (uracil1498-N3)-methyltransferase